MDLSHQKHARGKHPNLAVPRSLVIADVTRLLARQHAPGCRRRPPAREPHVPTESSIVYSVDEARQELTVRRPAFTTANCAGVA